MPEGDTIYRAAVTLRRALAGRIVRSLESTPPTFLPPARCAEVAARTIASIESVGKHLLMIFRAERDATGTPVSAAAPVAVAAPVAAVIGGVTVDLRRGDLVLNTHMGMNGSWHIYRPHERWRKSARSAGVVVRTDEFVAPCFSPKVAELLTVDEVTHHAHLRGLGNDLVRDGAGSGDAVRRMRRAPEAEIGHALMDQQAIAGIGNVYKSEVLFAARVWPFARVAELDDSSLARLVAEGRRLLRMNISGRGRRTMPGLNPHETLWVYARSGMPCRICGDSILMRRQGPLLRSTYYCPTCQKPSTSTS
jgi:endonuclease-8